MRKIAGAMHDAFDAEPITQLIKVQMLLKRMGCLEATDAGEFHGLKVAAQPKLGMGREALNRLIDSHQITFSHFSVGIFKIPSVLQGNILFCP